jgi:hypothetical protein
VLPVLLAARGASVAGVSYVKTLDPFMRGRDERYRARGRPDRPQAPNGAGMLGRPPRWQAWRTIVVVAILTATYDLLARALIGETCPGPRPG